VSVDRFASMGVLIALVTLLGCDGDQTQRNEAARAQRRMVNDGP